MNYYLRLNERLEIQDKIKQIAKLRGEVNNYLHKKAERVNNIDFDYSWAKNHQKNKKEFESMMNCLYKLVDREEDLIRNETSK